MATVNFDESVGGLAAKITPFKAVFNDTENVTHLRITLTNDNQKDRASLWWEVIDSKGIKHVSGTLVLTGEDYINYNVSKETRFTYVAGKIGVTFI